MSDLPLSATTRLFALLGDPVSHSASPRLYNAAFRAAHLDAAYGALRCAAADGPGLVRGLARAGGGGNVTVPHKAVAAAAVEEPTPAVTRTGACNTFWLEDGRIRGDNTDVAGFTAAAARLVPSLAGTRVLLLGAGGAARAVVAALLDAPAERVLLRNRSRIRADGLLADFPAGDRLRLAPDDLRGERFDLVVNATSLGLHVGDPLPLDLGTLAAAGAVLDLVYSPEETPLVLAARARGIAAADGKEMLVAQAEEAFERWWKARPPDGVMRAALG